MYPALAGRFLTTVPPGKPYLFIWVHWVFVAAHGLSLVAVSGGYSLLRCTGFSLQWLLLLWSTGSRLTGFSSCGSRALERRLSSCGTRALEHVGFSSAVCGLSSCGAWALGHMGFSSCGSRALECRLSSCGTWALLLHGMWDLPRPGIKPVSPALAGRFLTTAPPGKSQWYCFKIILSNRS